MTLIPELRQELKATLDREVREHRRGGHRRRWLFGLAPVILVAGTTAALAAGGVIGLGSPAEDPPEIARYAPERDTGTGTVLPGRERLLSVRAEDPDGGPPWGLQLASTTRGLGCLLAGRIAGGRIGALGRDGAFDNDGRLHPFSRDISRNPGECALLDAGDRLFMSNTLERAPANAMRLAPCAPGDRKRTLCAQGSERTVLYGTLGPEAESVTYSTPAGERTVQTVGPEGAYLIVLRAGPDEYPGGGRSIYPADGRIAAIRFRDGRTCSGDVLRSETAATACPLPGFRPLQPEPISQNQVAAKVTATARQGRRFWNMTVRFRAPVAITDASASYNIRLFPPGKTGRSARGFTSHNIAAGELVTERFRHLNGGGTYRIHVTYHRASDPGQIDPMGPNPVTVGRLRLRIP